MKKAKIIDIFSPDVENLFSFKPDDPEVFCILLQICVGMSGDDELKGSGETFDLEVYTPKWILANYAEDSVIFPKHSLIVLKFDYELIYKEIERNIESCYGDCWEEIAKKINGFAAWEFEGYQDKP